MAEQKILEVISQIWEQHPQQLSHLPGWWMLIMDQVSENIAMQEENSSQWHDLQENFRKLMKKWNQKFKKWEISSLDMLKEKASSVLIASLETLYSTPMINNLLNVWKSCVIMEDPDQEECLEYQSKMTTSTLSMIVPTQQIAVDVPSEKQSNLLQTLASAAQKLNPSTNSLQQTGMMSSSITFLENGALVTYGLEEKIGKNRLTVSIL